MDEFRAELPWLPGSMRQAEGFVATGPLPWAAERVAAPGVAVVGDAAGSPEPLTGEGMSWAIESAAFLAASINADSTPGFDARAAARYTATWNAHIHAGLRRCALLSRALEHPRVLGACSRLASRIPRLPEFIVRTVVPA